MSFANFTPVGRSGPHSTEWPGIIMTNFETFDVTVLSEEFCYCVLLQLVQFLHVSFFLKLTKNLYVRMPSNLVPRAFPLKVFPPTFKGKALGTRLYAKPSTLKN